MDSSHNFSRLEIPLPYTEEDIKQIASSAWLTYSFYGRVTPELVEQNLKGYWLAPKLTLGELLSLPSTKSLMEEMGLPDDAKVSYLTTKQVQCLQILLGATTTGTMATKLKKAGVTEAEFQSWMKQSTFYSAYRDLSEGKLETSVPSALSAIVDKANEGDLNAGKFVLEVTGRYNPNDYAQVDVKGLIAGVVEILQQELKSDTATMLRIAGRLNALQDQYVNQKEIQQ